VCALAAIAAGWRLFTQPAPTRREPTQFAIFAPKGMTLSWPRLSPDGRTLAFVGLDAEGTRTIWVRPLGAAEAVRLAGTEGVLRPFWSPDSRYLAFFAGTKLKKVLATGGPSQLICEPPFGADGSWSPSGVILFDGRQADPIYRVADSGGVPTVAAKADERQKEVGVGWPFFLPDGRHYLFAANDAQGPKTLKLGRLDSTENTVLMPIESRFEYSSGHIFYVSQQTLIARPFSAESQRFTGDAFPITDRMQTQYLGRADFSLSQRGDMTYITDVQQPLSRLLWFDRSGRELATIAASGLYREMALSPDESRLAVVIEGLQTASSYDVWVMDLKRGVTSRLTFDKEMEGWPVWSPDGNHVAFNKGVDGLLSLVQRKPASGAGAIETVYAGKSNIFAPMDWSPDGSRMLIQSVTLSGDNSDVFVAPATKADTLTPFIQTPAPLFEGLARFSPDGRWIAYQSNESGRAEIYIQSFPAPGTKYQVSTAGGEWPLWRGDGKELFYLGQRDTLHAVAIRVSGAALEIGQPVRLFQRQLNRVGIGAQRRWVVSRDGQRFLLNVPVENPEIAGAQVVLDWIEGLRK
jgi:Tol biopolymer transport system component